MIFMISGKRRHRSFLLLVSMYLVLGALSSSSYALKEAELSTEVISLPALESSLAVNASDVIEMGANEPAAESIECVGGVLEPETETVHECKREGKCNVDEVIELDKNIKEAEQDSSEVCTKNNYFPVINDMFTVLATKGFFSVFYVPQSASTWGAKYEFSKKRKEVTGIELFDPASSGRLKLEDIKEPTDEHSIINQGEGEALYKIIESSRYIPVNEPSNNDQHTSKKSKKSKKRKPVMYGDWREWKAEEERIKQRSSLFHFIVNEYDKSTDNNFEDCDSNPFNVLLLMNELALLESLKKTSAERATKTEAQRISKAINALLKALKKQYSQSGDRYQMLYELFATILSDDVNKHNLDNELFYTYYDKGCMKVMWMAKDDGGLSLKGEVGVDGSWVSVIDANDGNDGNDGNDTNIDADNDNDEDSDDSDEDSDVDDDNDDNDDNDDDIDAGQHDIDSKNIKYSGQSLPPLSHTSLVHREQRGWFTRENAVYVLKKGAVIGAGVAALAVSYYLTHYFLTAVASAGVSAGVVSSALSGEVPVEAVDPELNSSMDLQSGGPSRIVINSSGGINSSSDYSDVANTTDRTHIELSLGGLEKVQTNSSGSLEDLIQANLDSNATGSTD